MHTLPTTVPAPPPRPPLAVYGNPCPQHTGNGGITWLVAGPVLGVLALLILGAVITMMRANRRP